MPKRTRDQTEELDDDEIEEDDDDDEEEDEDYDVAKDEDEKREAALDAKEKGGAARGGAAGEEDTHAQAIKDEIQSLARSRRVDSLWESMKAEEKAAPKKLSVSEAVKKLGSSSSSSSSASGKSGTKKQKRTAAKKRRLDRKARAVLTGIFGATVGRSIVAKASSRADAEGGEAAAGAAAAAGAGAGSSG